MEHWTYVFYIRVFLPLWLFPILTDDFSCFLHKTYTNSNSTNILERASDGVKRTAINVEIYRKIGIKSNKMNWIFEFDF